MKDPTTQLQEFMKLQFNYALRDVVISFLRRLQRLAAKKKHHFLTQRRADTRHALVADREVDSEVDMR